MKSMENGKWKMDNYEIKALSIFHFPFSIFHLNLWLKIDLINL